MPYKLREVKHIIGYWISMTPWAWKINTYKFVNGQEVDLGKRVVNLENLREIVYNLVAVVKGKASLLLQASSGVHSDWDVFAIVFALRKGFNVLKVSNGPS